MRRTVFGCSVAAVLALTLSAWVEPAQAQSAAFRFTKTVGTDPSQCAGAQHVTVQQGSTVVYCYKITNTGNLTLTTHTLVDSVLGPITLPNGGAFDVAPGAMFFITETVHLTASVTNVATWTAEDPSGGVASSSGPSTAAAAVIPAASAPTLSDVGLGLSALALLLVGASRLTLQRNTPA